jgi:hypothetical protein
VEINQTARKEREKDTEREEMKDEIHEEEVLEDEGCEEDSGSEVQFHIDNLCGVPVSTGPVLCYSKE